MDESVAVMTDPPFLNPVRVEPDTSNLSRSPLAKVVAFAVARTTSLADPGCLMIDVSEPPSLQNQYVKAVEGVDVAPVALAIRYRY
jgi:hypothetical protein